ncbi:MAG: gliding motility-associated C-terminal domain-containing protein [Cytophagales bacterium]|nr:gliding motility-associated C-terminal domain-containing protein [Cytophagales bacterium]
MKSVFQTVAFLMLSIPAFSQWDYFNRPPTIDPIDDYGPVLENSGFHRIELTGIGPGRSGEVQKVTISARTDHSALITNLNVQYQQGSTAILSFLLGANANGEAEITVQLDDGQRFWNITEESFDVEVTPVNGKPSFQLVSDLVEVEENAGKITRKKFATDLDDGDPEEHQKLAFAVSIESVAGILTFRTDPKIKKDGDLEFEANDNTFGEALVSVVLNDDGGTEYGGVDTSDEKFFIIKVQNINNPPTLDPIPSPLTIWEDAGQRTVQLTGISSGESEHQQLQITATSDNVQLVSTFDMEYQQGAATAQLKFIVEPNAFGKATITVRVDDGQPEDNIISRQFTLIVEPKADTPSITDALYELPPHTTSGLVVSRSPVDGDEVTHFKVTDIQDGKLYHNDGITQISDNQFITYQAGSLGLKFAPFAGISSNGTFKIQAATGADNSKLGGNLVLANIIVDNDPPSIASSPDTVVEITRFYIYNIAANDPNASDNLTITAQIPQAIRVWLNFREDGDWKALLSGTPPSGSAGVYEIKIRVEDQFGAFDEQIFDLHVNELNKLPVLSPYSVSIMEDDTIRFKKNDFQIRFSDADGDTLRSWKMASVPQYGRVFLDGAEISVNEEVRVDEINSLAYVPRKDYFGLDIFDWNASDGKDYALIPQRLSVFITSVNDPPEILKFEENPFVFEYAEESLTLTDSGEVVDADGDKIEKMVITISDNYIPYEDSLYYESVEDLDFNWSDSAGVLTVRGIASSSVFQEALRSVKYINLNRLAPNGRTRDIEILLFDADTFSIPYLREIEFKNTFVDLVIPTGFTPNDDGVNDSWKIENLSRYEDYKVAVYSRSGQMVFESNDYLKEWDGSHGGYRVPVGAYFYVININKFEKVFKGTVTVLR